MRLFENDAQLAYALRILSEAGLIDIVAGDDGKPRFQLSAAITKGAEAGLIDIVVAGSNREPGYRLSDAITKPRAQGGDPVRADPDGSRRARRSGA